MEKKLYRVRVVLYVMAENESDACVAATQARFDIFDCAARRAKNVDPEWRNTIPYNADDDLTCAENIASAPQIVCPRIRSLKLPSYLEAGIRAFNSDNLSIQFGQPT